MECPYCLKSRPVLPLSEIQIPNLPKKKFTKLGHYFRSCDQKLVQRFKCQACKKSYSSETTHPCKYQKKRFLNQAVFELLVSGISQNITLKMCEGFLTAVITKGLREDEVAWLEQFHRKQLRLPRALNHFKI